MKDKTKLRVIVKTFLCANKGKYYTSRELCDFINSNDLATRLGVTPTSLSRFLDPALLRREGIDRERKNNRNVWYYGVPL